MLLLLLIAQIAIGVVALLAIQNSDNGGFQEAVTNATQQLFNGYNDSNDAKSTVDYIQQEVNTVTPTYVLYIIKLIIFA